MNHGLQKTKTLAGIGVGSGRKESFYFCAFQYFEDEQRWFLKNCQQLKDVQYPDTEDSLLALIKDYGIELLMVDFPLTHPVCESCELVCPGSINCPDERVVKSRQKIGNILKSDELLYTDSPKEYERQRKSGGVISKSLKRKLKKGFVPYWNREDDLGLWLDYHDDLLKYFKVSYDSFGNENRGQIQRFQYLRRHFPSNLKLLETHYHILLLEMFKSDLVAKKSLKELVHIESAALSRLNIIESLEEKFNLFIYEKDKEVLVKKSRAFKSFIIGLSGTVLYEQRNDFLSNKFVIPEDFSHKQ